MGRLKVQLARSERDRALQRHVAAALRELGKAQALCAQVRRHRRHATDYEPQISVIARAFHLLDGIGHLTPQVDYDGDPDLMPEDQRHVIEAISHLADAEEPLEQALVGVRQALAAFHRADDILPLDGQALAEGRRAQRIARVLTEAGRLLGGVSPTVAADDEPVVSPRRKRQPEPPPEEPMPVYVEVNDG
jgi:hypothetical protein